MHPRVFCWRGHPRQVVLLLLLLVPLGSQEKVAEAMECMAVNWPALDHMVLDYVHAERLVHDSSQTQASGPYSASVSGSDSVSHEDSRGIIERIRLLIESGSIEQAIELIRQFAPAVLEDQRILFGLYKQNFVELLRSGLPEDRAQAIDCSRKQLGPCALNAYPEAYEEFKRVLLILIYDKNDLTSPVTAEWSEGRRTELAAMVASTLKAHLRAYDPLFSLTLRYLISVHKLFCTRQGLTSPIAEIANEILSKERDPPPNLPESGEALAFNEVDVQALAQAVEVPRQTAINSLRYTQGDIQAAFKNELSRMRVDTAVIDKVVWEYCVYRGLIESSINVFANGNSDSYIDVGGDAGVTCDTNGLQESPSSLDEDFKPGITREQNYAHISEDTQMEDRAKELDALSGPESMNEGTATCINNVICQGMNNVVEANVARHKMKNGQRRWKGRSCIVIDNTARELKMLLGGKVEPADVALRKYRQSLKVRELISGGFIAESIEAVRSLDKDFFEKNPQLLFQIKQVEFFKYAEGGEHSKALMVAQTDLGPLASRYPHLLKPLKETVLALARPQEDNSAKVSLVNLATSIQVELSTSLGINEPLLMTIMRVTLSTHTEWFKLQMCADPFGELLNINTLKDSESIMSKCHPPIQGKGEAVPVAFQDSAAEMATTQKTQVLDEGSILTIMEWMALPRGDAIQLLVDHEGNIDSVFEHLVA